MTPENPKDSPGKKGKRVGVYICHCGGNISDHVDVNKVAER
jgi:heterodisulfide reductase subunit A